MVKALWERLSLTGEIERKWKGAAFESRHPTIQQGISIMDFYDTINMPVPTAILYHRVRGRQGESERATMGIQGYKIRKTAKDGERYFMLCTLGFCSRFVVIVAAAVCLLQQEEKTLINSAELN